MWQSTKWTSTERSIAALIEMENFLRPRISDDFCLIFRFSFFLFYFDDVNWNLYLYAASKSSFIFSEYVASVSFANSFRFAFFGHCCCCRSGCTQHVHACEKFSPAEMLWCMTQNAKCECNFILSFAFPSDLSMSTVECIHDFATCFYLFRYSTKTNKKLCARWPGMSHSIGYRINSDVCLRDFRAICTLKWMCKNVKIDLSTTRKKVTNRRLLIVSRAAWQLSIVRCSLFVSFLSLCFVARRHYLTLSRCINNNIRYHYFLF